MIHILRPTVDVVPSEDAEGPDTGRAQAGATRQQGSRHDRRLELGMALLRIGPLLMLIGIVVLLAVAEPVFLTTRNIGNVLAQSAFISTLALGQLLVIITRGVDLSVGANAALASVIGALAFASFDSGVAIVAIMLSVGLLVGFLNGMVYVWGRMPHPFIVTLASLSICRGLALLLADGRSTNIPGGMPDIVRFLGSGSTLS
jgi:ribose transport system permease protein